MIEITYTQAGDYLIPNLTLPETPAFSLGKYGMMLKSYLKNHRKITYSTMLLDGTLMDYLHKAEQAAQERIDQIVAELARQEGVTEELKATDQMRWVGLMNNFQAQAEEIVLEEIICS